MRRSCGCRDGEGRRGGGVKAEEKRPALSALTRGDGEETTLLTGGVDGDHLSVRGEWWRWAGLFPACGWAGVGLAGSAGLETAQLGWLPFFFVLLFFFFLFCVLFIVSIVLDSKSFSKFL